MLDFSIMTYETSSTTELPSYIHPKNAKVVEQQTMQTGLF